MALVTCRECRTSVSDQARACPKCGAPVFKTSPPRKHAVDRAAIWVPATILGFAILLWLAPERTPQQDAETEARIMAQRTIDTCWEQQARKSFSPEAQRFLAGACEKFEEDYRSKHGRYYKKYGKNP